MRTLTAAIVLCLSACASSTGAVKPEGKSAEPVVEKMAVVNNIKFDLSSCSVKPIETTLNETIVTAALLSARPAYSECLIDPNNRGPAADTQINIKATANETEVKFDVASPNLAPGGKACIEKALASLGLKPLAKGVKPIEITIPYAFSAIQGVRFGTNMASDLVGAIRVAQGKWCDCFASLANSPPPGLQAALRAQPEKPLEVVMKAPAGDPIAACLESKIKTVALPKIDREVTVNYQFLLINGLAAQETAEAVPTLQFHQLDAIGQGREVDVAMSVGAIELAWSEYQDGARRYNAKPGSGLMKELREKCATLLVRDETLRGSLEALKTTYERTQTVVAGLKPSDPIWAQIDASVGDRLAATTKELNNSIEQKKAHNATCQKLK